MNFKTISICGLDYDTAMTMHGGHVEIVIIYHSESWRTKILNLATIQVDRALRCLRVCECVCVGVRVRVLFFQCLCVDVDIHVSMPGCMSV